MIVRTPSFRSHWKWRRNWSRVCGFPRNGRRAVHEALSHVEERRSSTCISIRMIWIHCNEQNSVIVDARRGGPNHFHSTNDVSRGGCLVQTRFGVMTGVAKRNSKLSRSLCSMIEVHKLILLAPGGSSIS